MWEDENAESFDSIKHAISTATLMQHPHPSKPFITDCDAPLTGLGAALHQQDECGKEYFIAFASRTLKPNERKWTITDLEALAVVWAIETF